MRLLATNFFDCLTVRRRRRHDIEVVGVQGRERPYHAAARLGRRHMGTHQVRPAASSVTSVVEAVVCPTKITFHVSIPFILKLFILQQPFRCRASGIPVG